MPFLTNGLMLSFVLITETTGSCLEESRLTPGWFRGRCKRFLVRFVFKVVSKVFYTAVDSEGAVL